MVQLGARSKGARAFGGGIVDGSGVDPFFGVPEPR
jgi:hypothetical protein